MKIIFSLLVLLTGLLLPLLSLGYVTQLPGGASQAFPQIRVFALILPAFIFVSILAHFLLAPALPGDDTSLRLMRVCSICYSFAGASIVTFCGLADYFRVNSTTGNVLLFGTMIASIVYAIFGLLLGSASGALMQLLRERRFPLGGLVVHLPFVFWLGSMVVQSKSPPEIPDQNRVPPPGDGSPLSGTDASTSRP